MCGCDLCQPVMTLSSIGSMKPTGKPIFPEEASTRVHIKLIVTLAAVDEEVRWENGLSVGDEVAQTPE